MIGISTSAGPRHYWHLWLDKCGYKIVEIDADGLATQSRIVPLFVSKGYAKNLVEIYPNPAVNETTIRFVNKADSKVNISLMDIQGKTIIPDIVNEFMIIGNYEVKMNVENLKSATYYLKVDAGDKVIFKKVIVLNK